jgi:hypothetical protein
MDRDMTGAAHNQGFAAPCGHALDPGRFLCASLHLQICQLAHRMHFAVLRAAAEFAGVREEPFDQFRAPISDDGGRPSRRWGQFRAALKRYSAPLATLCPLAERTESLPCGETTGTFPRPRQGRRQRSSWRGPTRSVRWREHTDSRGPRPRSSGGWSGRRPSLGCRRDGAAVSCGGAGRNGRRRATTRPGTAVRRRSGSWPTCGA